MLDLLSRWWLKHKAPEDEDVADHGDFTQEEIDAAPEVKLDAEGHEEDD